LLWANAIYINQGDIVERNKQVAMIALTFQNASRYVIDIGEVSANSAVALDDILAFCGCIDAENVLELCRSKAADKAIRKLYEHPWLRLDSTKVDVTRCVFDIYETKAYPWEIFRSHPMLIKGDSANFSYNLPKRMPFMVRMKSCIKRYLHEDTREELLLLLR
jgi:Heterokaryon incompatibility protein (HET)